MLGAGCKATKFAIVASLKKGFSVTVCPCLGRNELDEVEVIYWKLSEMSDFGMIHRYHGFLKLSATGGILDGR